MDQRLELFHRGTDLLCRFCDLNQITIPEIKHEHARWSVSACAYYRLNQISIHLPSCALIGRAAQAWSYPGYKVDRTPYGVLQHELGHHVDVLCSDRKFAYWGDLSSSMRNESGEQKLTNYCPNDAEWFAEMFRLFVTNPSLLEQARPKTYRLMRERWRPAETRRWSEVLWEAPERTMQKAAKFDW